MNRAAKIIVLGFSLLLASGPAWADYWGDKFYSDKDHYYFDKDHHDRDDHHHHYNTVPNPDIGAGIPSRYAVSANAEALARYAALCQEAGIVPIVEPEVLMDGDHPIARCEEVTDGVLQTVFDHLFAELPAHLHEQRATARRYASKSSGH